MEDFMTFNDYFDTFIVINNSHSWVKQSPEEKQKMLDKHLPIIFRNEECYYDEVGGFHSEAHGYNPNGVDCGMCTAISCKNCPSRFLTKN